MRVFIRASHDDFPETEIEYAAFQGFSALGYKPVFYTDEKQLENCHPDDLVVGRVSAIVKHLKSYEITLENYDYPEELSRYLGRKVWTDTLEHVTSNSDMWPVFIKPVRDKVFTGFVLRKANDIPNLHKAVENETLYCSELISFQAEWRVFVRYGNIIGVRPYKGDWRVQYDPGRVMEMISAFKSAPAGYSMDIGVTDNGETVLVEINDGFALGHYGLDPVEYAKLLSARWCELVGISDDCDRYYEKIDWINKKQSLEDNNIVHFYCEEQPTIRIIGFYHETEPYGAFSNWYPATFILDGITYSSSEQYMMYQKALLFNDEEIAVKILNETNPLTVKRLGRNVKGFNNAKWDEENMKIMINGLRAKFTQNEDIIKDLVNTGNAVLAECAPNDRIWGIGLSLKGPYWDLSKWRGENRLGRVLMALRDEFQNGIERIGFVPVYYGDDCLI